MRRVTIGGCFGFEITDRTKASPEAAAFCTFSESVIQRLIEKDRKKRGREDAAPAAAESAETNRHSKSDKHARSSSTLKKDDAVAHGWYLAGCRPLLRRHIRELLDGFVEYGAQVLPEEKHVTRGLLLLCYFHAQPRSALLTPDGRIFLVPIDAAPGAFFGSLCEVAWNEQFILLRDVLAAAGDVSVNSKSMYIRHAQMASLFPQSRIWDPLATPSLETFLTITSSSHGFTKMATKEGDDDPPTKDDEGKDEKKSFSTSDASFIAGDIRGSGSGGSSGGGGSSSGSTLLDIGAARVVIGQWLPLARLQDWLSAALSRKGVILCDGEPLSKSPTIINTWVRLLPVDRAYHPERIGGAFSLYLFPRLFCAVGTVRTLKKLPGARATEEEFKEEDEAKLAVRDHRYIWDRPLVNIAAQQLDTSEDGAAEQSEMKRGAAFGSDTIKNLRVECWRASHVGQGDLRFEYTLHDRVSSIDAALRQGLLSTEADYVERLSMLDFRTLHEAIDRELSTTQKKHETKRTAPTTTFV